VSEPLRGARVLAVRAFYLGPAETAERLLRPLLEAAGPPLLDRFGPAGFAEASQAAAGPPLPPMAVRDHLDLFETVPDSALDAMVEAAADPESPLAFAELRHWGGAMARPSPDAGPVGHPDCRSRSPRRPPTTEATSRSGSTRPWTGWSRGCDRALAAARS
jgi:hypothetical protein